MKRFGANGRFAFPKEANLLRPILGISLVAVPAYLVLLVWLGGSPKTFAVGYQPEQPVPYSHALHAGELGINCRYCHTTVETAAKAAIPPTQTCMNCHAKIRAGSEKLIPVRESFATGMPIPWVKVHDLPQYVYFNHSAHVTRGVGCVECHGRVDRMEVVRQVETLSMSWCLDCHRDPDRHLRPPEAVTTMDWVAPEEPSRYGRRLREARNIRPSTDCATCHR
jgi:menaquinone reductase, multiheme cytochrome c subunit